MTAAALGEQSGREPGFARVPEDGGRIWTFILLGHALRAGAKCLAPSLRGGAPGGRPRQ